MLVPNHRVVLQENSLKHLLKSIKKFSDLSLSTLNYPFNKWNTIYHLQWLCVSAFCTLTCPLPGRLQWSRAERPAGRTAESQAQCGEQQHCRDQCRVCGPQWWPPPHDCGRHLWSRCGNHHHRTKMGCHLPHPSPTGKGGAAAFDWERFQSMLFSHTTILHLRGGQHFSEGHTNLEKYVKGHLCCVGTD